LGGQLFALIAAMVAPDDRPWPFYWCTLLILGPLGVAAALVAQPRRPGDAGLTNFESQRHPRRHRMIMNSGLDGRGASMALDRRDIFRGDAVIRELRYSERDIAVVDASEDVITVNWSTEFSPTQFVDAVEELADEGDVRAADVTLDVRHELLSMSMEGLRRRMAEDGPKIFDHDCVFIRLDLSDTRTVAWQRLTDDGLVVAGFGDGTPQIVASHDGLAQSLMSTTATEPINADEVTQSLSELALRYQSYA
jgi:hypothetical protein